MAGIDKRLLKQLKQLQQQNQNLQGQVRALTSQANNQDGGFRQKVSRMRNALGSIHNPRISNSRLSPVPPRLRGRHLY